MALKKIGLLAGLASPILIFCLTDFSGSRQINAMAAIAVMMAIFWLSEAIPLAATALLPLILFPLFGIASSKATAAQFMNSTVFLLIGGFMIALAMQRWNLHKRIALNILVVTGDRPLALAGGFMLATACLSMWVSNTATTLLMLPIASAVIVRCQQLLTEQQARLFSVGLFLLIAYSASIGGMMTLIGSAPNLVFARFYEVTTNDAIGFLQWMLIAVPVGIGLLGILLGLIYIGYLRNIPRFAALGDFLVEERRHLGACSPAEKTVLIIFMITAVLWVTRKGIDVGDFVVPGWSDFLPYGELIDDGSVAIAMATSLFFLPGLRGGERGRTAILDETVFRDLPWSVVLLFGGGFALAFGFTESGLSVFLAEQLQGLKHLYLPGLIFIVTAGMSLLTELTSNTATAQLVMPLLMATASVIEVSPVWMMLPSVLAASCAFMFPVATPPNTIVFATGKLRVADMLKIGFILNCLSILLISSLCYLLIPVVLSVD